MRWILALIMTVFFSTNTVWAQQIGLGAMVQDPYEVIGVVTCLDGFAFAIGPDGELRILMPGDLIYLRDSVFVQNGKLLLGGSAKDSLKLIEPKIPRIGMAAYIDGFVIATSDTHEPRIMLPLDFLEEGDSIVIERGTLVIY